MKKLFFIMIILSGMAFISLFISKSRTSNFSAKGGSTSGGQSPTTTIPSPTATPTVIIEYNNKRFSLYIQPIVNTADLTLISNFTEKKSSQEIMEQNNCRYGINGGFYTTDDKPLGLFRSHGETLSKQIESSLLTGVFYQTADNSLFIDTTTFARGPLANGARTDSLSFALQSGPYFTTESGLKIKDDEYARRMLVAQDAQGDFSFIAITEQENTHSGPLLADLPNIIKELNSINLNAIPYTLNAILNLDGGSASAFYSQNGTKLMEITPIGSLLCGK